MTTNESTVPIGATITSREGQSAHVFSTDTNQNFGSCPSDPATPAFPPTSPVIWHRMALPDGRLPSDIEESRTSTATPGRRTVYDLARDMSPPILLAAPLNRRRATAAEALLDKMNPALMSARNTAAIRLTTFLRRAAIARRAERSALSKAERQAHLEEQAILELARERNRLDQRRAMARQCLGLSPDTVSSPTPAAPPTDQQTNIPFQTPATLLTNDQANAIVGDVSRQMGLGPHSYVYYDAAQLLAVTIAVDQNLRVASLRDDPLMPDLCTPSDSDDEDSTPHRRRRVLQPPPPPRSLPAATRDLHLGGGAGPTRAALLTPHDLPDLIPVDTSWRVPATLSAQDGPAAAQSPHDVRRPGPFSSPLPASPPLLERAGQPPEAAKASAVAIGSPSRDDAQLPRPGPLLHAPTPSTNNSPWQ